MKERIIKIVDICLESILLGLVFFIPISSAGVEIFASFLLLFFIIKKIIHPDFRTFKNSLHLFLLVFMITLALSLLNSGPYLEKSFKALFFKWFEYIGIFLMVEDTLRNSDKKLKKILMVFIFVGILIGIDGIIQRFSGYDFLRKRGLIEIKEQQLAITGPFHHYNNFAGYLVFTLLLIISLFLDKDIKYRRGLFLIISLLGFNLIFTYSRGGWIGLFAGLIFISLITRRIKPIIISLFFFITMILIDSSLFQRLFFTFQLGGDSGRLMIWKTGSMIIKENILLGKGVGTYMDYLYKYAPQLGVQYSHNCFLQILVETGLFGLLSFLGFISTIFYQAIKKFKEKEDFVLLGLTSGIFGFLVHSFFDNHMYSLQLAVLFWFFLGVLVSYLKNKSINST